MENRSSSSDADALPSGGLAGVINIEQPVRESATTNIPQEQPDGEIPEEVKDMMDLDIAESEGEKPSVATTTSPPPPPLPPPPPPPPPESLPNDTPEHDRMTTPPPPPSLPPPATPALPPTTTRDLRQILQAAGSIRTHFPNRSSVPPSPVVKPGALHEFEVSDPTSPSTRRRSSATAGIAGLEELRNRIEAEEVNKRPMEPYIGPLDQLIQATTTDLDDGFGDIVAQQRDHVIDAFVRLDFDDGHVFYVRNSSVVFGRAEGASSNSFQLGPDGSTVIGSNPFGGFDPTTTPGAMSMKREKKKRRKKKGDSKKSKSTTSVSSGGTRQTFPMFRDSFSSGPYPFAQNERVDEVPIIHLPLASADAEVAQPPKKNISRRHAVLNYNFAKRRFELKITGKNGAFVEDEFVHCDTTWVVSPNGMRVQIGGVGFKVVVPQVPGGGFEVDAAPVGRGKGKMSTSFTDEYGNEVSDDEDEMEQDEGSRDSDESMEGESEEEGSGDEDEDDEDDEEAQEGDVENSEDDEEEDSEESDEEAEVSPPPEPVKVEKKRGRGRPRKDEAEIARQELEKAKAKEKAKEKERRHKEKLEAARRAKEAEREKERERKRQEEIRQKEERAKQKERTRREKEQLKEQKKLHLPQPKEKEEPKKKLYLPAPAAKKKEADKSLTSQTKKGPGRPPKVKPPSPPPALQQVHESPVSSTIETATSVSPSIPEPEQAFSPSNPLMAVAAFNANTPAIDPALYGASTYAPMPIHQTPQQETPKPSREPKQKKEKPPVKKRTPSPEINEADYPPEALLKPAASYVILIHEAISNSAEKALTLPQIYKAIERKYPYFKLRVTTTGWQSSVRHNLGAHKAFCKVTRSGKGWMWGINEGVSIEKEKNKANIAASRPPVYQPPIQSGYQNGNGVYHQQQGMNGYPAHNMSIPTYGGDHTGVSNGVQRPMYQPVAAPQTPQYQPQQTARMPPMPMAYQPPTQGVIPPAPNVMSNGQMNRQPSQQFPNAPIPPPAGKPSAQQPGQNGFAPETLAAIHTLQKQLAALTSQGSAASSSIPNVSPLILNQAQQVLAGLMSGKLNGRFGGGADIVNQLSKVLVPQAAGKSAAVSPSAPSVSPVTGKPTTAVAPAASPTTPAISAPAPAPVSVPAPVPAPTAGASAAQPGSSSQGAAPAKTVDFKNLPPDKKRQLYRALLAAKEKKEKELREAAAGIAGNTGSPAGVKRQLDDGGAGPVAKKIDVGSGGGDGSAG